MSGRGDKNKSSTAGRGSSKQSSQPFSQGGSSSNKNKRARGGSHSKPESDSFDPSANRGRGHVEDKLDSPGGEHRNFNLLVDSVPYVVSATSYQFNNETRYRVSINGNDEHIFTWDSDLKRLKAIDDESSILPDNVEEAISTKLQSK
jgi:hypothetical protein